MTTREDVSALVQRMQECFNSRQFDQAADLHTPGFYSHPLGTPGFEAGKRAWQVLVARHPGIRVVAQDILVDGDKAAVRSTVEGITVPDGDTPPMLFEIFRIEDGRFAEMWGPARGSRPRPAPRSCSPGEQALVAVSPLGGGGAVDAAAVDRLDGSRPPDAGAGGVAADRRVVSVVALVPEVLPGELLVGAVRSAAPAPGDE
ncbi:nuclear transport factor 2 family protein [Nonomuraea rubra]|uniref:nuclear transport factor 2 family protein n=1 Tax=Nonomuraea rubra TaxID=46180 RepID=UPI00360EE948